MVNDCVCPSLVKTLCYSKRIPKEQWWLKLRPLLRILAKHSVVSYEMEAEMKNIDEDEDDEEGEHIL